MHTIIPAILPESFEDLAETLARVRGVAPRVQVDVCNGTYAKTKTWPYHGGQGALHFEAIQKESEGMPYWDAFDFEIDLLLKHPEHELAPWVQAGAMCLIVHAETTDAMAHIVEYCSEAHANVELGIATLPQSPIELVAPWLPHVSFVQVMGSNVVGEQGRTLEEGAAEKVQLLRERFPTATIGVDIGVSEETLPILIEAGATRFAVGSAIFGDAEPRHAYRALVEIGA